MIQSAVMPAQVVVVPPGANTPEVTPTPPVGAYVDRVRVDIYQGNVIIVADKPEGYQIQFQEKILPETYQKGDRNTDYRVTTVSGKQLVWRKDFSCGCGSRLRTWRPYKHLGSILDPGPEDE